MSAEVRAALPGVERGIAQVWAHPNAFADAQLMAAAPELLVACKAFVEAEDALIAELRAAGTLPDLTEKPWGLVDDMRAAIAKAEAKPAPVGDDRGTARETKPESPTNG